METKTFWLLVISEWPLIVAVRNILSKPHTDFFTKLLFLEYSVCIFLENISYFYSKSNKMHQCFNLFYFWKTHYMFRTVCPSINRRSRLYIQQQAFVKPILMSACYQASKQTAVYDSKETAISDKCPLLYVQSWSLDDGRKDQPKHV